MSKIKEELFDRIVDERQWLVADAGVPVVAPAPEQVSVILETEESFVINGTVYTVKADRPAKVGPDVRGFYYRQDVGFAGRQFVILAADGRRIVTHNLWVGESTDEPDTAKFEGAIARPVKLSRHSWERGA